MAKAPKPDELILVEVRLIVEQLDAIYARLGDVLAELIKPTPPPPPVDIEELVTAVEGIAAAMTAMLRAMGGQYAAATEEAPSA